MEVFRHIRYATAKRFEEPVLAELSTVGAIADKPTACYQNALRLGFLLGDTEPLSLTEDCQFLSIWTPSCEGDYPVLVWIHGGAYIAGTGEEAAYDGAELCRQGNMVVVTISYRLGVFGYLYNEEKGVVNLGLKDQLMALRWVKAHIARFGGDPEKITLAGHSAGGHSVAAILSSCNEPLFRRAIIQSAPLSMRSSRQDGNTLFRQFLNAAGKPLEELTSDETLEAQKTVLSYSKSMMPLGPIEPDFTGKTTVGSLGKVLVTWQKDDAAPFVALALKHQQHFGNAIDKIATHFATKKVFGAPAKQYAKALNAQGVPAEVRCLDWRPQGSPFGACHFLELALLFGSWKRWEGTKMLGQTSYTEWEDRSKQLRAEWISFIE